jgi:hypothetical protein
VWRSAVGGLGGGVGALHQKLPRAERPRGELGGAARGGRE